MLAVIALPLVMDDDEVGNIPSHSFVHASLHSVYYIFAQTTKI
jgi:hypothetical protein